MSAALLALPEPLGVPLRGLQGALAPLYTSAAQTAAGRRLSQAPTPSPTPNPRHRLLSVTPARLAGIYVGTLDDEAFVLIVRPRVGGEPIVDCSFNAGMKEPLSFGAFVAPRKGLEGRQVPSLDVSFGPVYEDEARRLWIPLVDDRGRLRGELTETKPKDRR